MFGGGGTILPQSSLLLRFVVYSYVVWVHIYLFSELLLLVPCLEMVRDYKMVVPLVKILNC